MSKELPNRDGWVTGVLADYPPVPPFPNFTDLERQALDCIASGLAQDEAALRVQLAHCQVIDRINTIVGFYTRVAVDRQAAPALQGLMRGPEGAQIELVQATYGLIFLLWFEDGYLETIEGALNASGCGDGDGDTFAGVDLNALRIVAVVFDDGRRVELAARPSG
jgi:hypothetical protein